MDNITLIKELTLLRGWFYSNLINPEKPMNKESAGKALESLQGLIERLESKASCKN